MAVRLEIFICLCPEIVWGYNDTCTLHFSSWVPPSVCLSVCLSFCLSEHFSHLISFRTTSLISTNLFTKQTRVKVFQVCSNEGPQHFSLGDAVIAKLLKYVDIHLTL